MIRMKNSQFKKFNYLTKNGQNFTFKDEVIKTTNINILLNRVRQKKKIELKNKLILSILMVSILSLAGILMFIN
jgi:hypothetical protein